MKPQKYTLPDQHVAYVFTLAKERNVVVLCNWGEKVLKDLIQARSLLQLPNQERYVGCGQVITRIVYHALGMTDHLLKVLDKEKVYWEEIEGGKLLRRRHGGSTR